MSIPDKIMHFRRERAQELRRYADLLEKHVGGFEIGGKHNVKISSHRRGDALRLGRFRTDGVVECQWPVKNSARNLAPVGHLAQRRCIESGWNF